MQSFFAVKVGIKIPSKFLNLKYNKFMLILQLCLYGMSQELLYITLAINNDWLFDELNITFVEHRERA